MSQDTTDTAADYATLNRLLDTRHSCRGFLPTPLPRETIVQIMKTAQKSASWCNAQPWHVHVVSGQPLERLRAALVAALESGKPAAPDIPWPREYRGLYQQRRRDCGWSLYEAVGIGKGDREGSARQAGQNFSFFGAPHMLVLSSDEPLGIYGTVDCGAWVAQFMLAATSLGVATIAQAAVASWPDILREHLGIAADRTIICGLSFGLEDIAHRANGFRTTRAPIGETTSWVE